VSFVLERMDGGELFDRLIRRGAYTESEIRVSFKRVAEALAYLCVATPAARGLRLRDA
jgi:hypothetical protein